MVRILFLAFLILPLAACWGEEEGQAYSPKSNILVIQSENGARHSFEIELALTQEQQMQGLMFREALDENAGMLFYWGGEEREQSFWMKNTLIPLDLIFIKRDGTIHHIHPSAIPHDLTSISSNGPVAAVLEINGGRAEELEIQNGDAVIHPLFQ